MMNIATLNIPQESRYLSYENSINQMQLSNHQTHFLFMLKIQNKLNIKKKKKTSIQVKQVILNLVIIATY